MTRPGFTTATQPSGEPFPEPMRVSAGFLVTGLSGNRLIHTFPPRLILRVIATRAASIWRFVIHAASSDFRPYSPNWTVVPPLARPALRPRCCLRCLTRFGVSMGLATPPVTLRGVQYCGRGHLITTSALTAAAPAATPATAGGPVARTAAALRRRRGVAVHRQVALGHHLALVDPALDADAPEG